MTQRIEITDNRNQECLSMEFPQHYISQILPSLSLYIEQILRQRHFTIRFNPAISIPDAPPVPLEEILINRTQATSTAEGNWYTPSVPSPKIPRGLIILAALAAAIEEG